MTDPSLAVVIPTRHRTALALNAVRSLLDQDCAIEIFVSDNSTKVDSLPDDLPRDPRVHYLRPPRELGSGAHFDWAMRESLSRSAATHFTVHHDRKWSKRNAWSEVLAIARRFPDALVSSGVDSITCVPPPHRLWQPPWSGRAFRIATRRVAQLISSGIVAPIIHAVPLIVNSVVPRPVLDSIALRFGNVCDSTGPDMAFAARFLALYDDYIHLDISHGVLYAEHRSTNSGYHRGEGGDFADFRRLAAQDRWLEAAPLPGLNLGSNLAFHEYELVRRATGDRLPPLDRAACLNELGSALRFVHDAALRDDSVALLRQAGWRGAVPPPLAVAPASRLRSAAVKATLHAGALVGWRRPNISGSIFRDDAEALSYAVRFPRRRQTDVAHLALLRPQEMDAA